MQTKPAAVPFGRAIWLLAALALVTAPRAAAQAPRAICVVEWPAGEASALRAALEEPLEGAGYAVDRPEAVAAARAFAGGEGPLDEEAAQQLRVAMGAPLLVWLSVIEGPDGGALWALRLLSERPAQSEFGAAPADAVAAVASGALRRRLSGGAAEVAPPASAISPPRSQSPAVSTPPEPAPLVPAAAPPSVGAPAAPEPASEAPASAPAAPPTPSPVTSTLPAGVGPALPIQALVSEAPRAEAAPRGEAALDTDAPAADPRPLAPARSMNVRLAIVAFAGIEGYGYGGGLRLELPMVRAGDGDNALSFGLDLGASYDQVGLDGQHAWHALQIPGAAYLSWRIDTGDLQIAPRVGVAGVVRLAWLEGSATFGERQDLIGMVLVGLSLAPWVGDVQLFFAADLTIGPRVGAVFTAGVAL